MYKSLVSVLLIILIIFFTTGCFGDKQSQPDGRSHTAEQSQTKTSSLRGNPFSSIDETTAKLLKAGGVTERDLTVKKSDLQSNPQQVGDSEFEEYVDSNGVSYTFDKKTGENIGFYKTFRDLTDSSEASNAKVLSLKELREIAESLLSLKVDLGKYTYTGDDELRDESFYQFSYVRMINGYKSMEFCIIYIKSNGIIRYYINRNTGMFDGLDIPEIDDKKLKDRLLTELEKKYKQKIGDVEIESMTLDYEEGAFKMLVLYSAVVNKVDRHDMIYIPIE